MTSHEEKVVYFEKHSEEFEKGKLHSSSVTYFNPDGKVLGSLSIDYSLGLAVPSYILRDKRYGKIQGVRWHNDQLQSFTQKLKENEGQIENVYPIQDPLVMTGPGLYAYIGNKLEFLERQNILAFQYVIPGRREVLDFYIHYISTKNNIAEIEVTLGPWPLNLLGPRMKFIFDKVKKRLLFYRGPGNIRGENGRMMTVKTEYYYSN